MQDTRTYKINLHLSLKTFYRANNDYSSAFKRSHVGFVVEGVLFDSSPNVSTIHWLLARVYFINNYILSFRSEIVKPKKSPKNEFFTFGQYH